MAVLTEAYMIHVSDYASYLAVYLQLCQLFAWIWRATKSKPLLLLLLLLILLLLLLLLLDDRKSLNRA